MPRAAKVAKLNSINPGLITIKHPKKPIITATHLLNPTFSFKKIDEKIVTINGAIKAKVNAFDNDICEIE